MLSLAVLQEAGNTLFDDVEHRIRDSSIEDDVAMAIGKFMEKVSIKRVSFFFCSDDFGYRFPPEKDVDFYKIEIQKNEGNGIDNENIKSFLQSSFDFMYNYVNNHIDRYFGYTNNKIILNYDLVPGVTRAVYSVRSR